MFFVECGPMCLDYNFVRHTFIKKASNPSNGMGLPLGKQSRERDRESERGGMICETPRREE